MSTALVLCISAAAFSSSFQGTCPSVSNRTAASPPTGKVVAAIVDGHVIPMEGIALTCVREDRDYVVDEMIQAFVVEREAKRRGMIAGEGEIDKRVDEFRKAIAPSTVSATLVQHQMTMAELRDAFRVAIESDELTAVRVAKPSRMVHCLAIRLRCTPDGVPKSVSGAKYTADEAAKALRDIQNQLDGGADFGALAAQYGEPGSSDLGVLYDKMLNVDSAVLSAGLSLGKGEITKEPLKTSDSYYILKAVSTSDDHPKAEDGFYADALQAYRKTQIMFLQPKVIGDLIAKCKITYLKDAELVEGKPLPPVAATVDGHPIPMSVVERKCVANVGHRAANIAIEDYVVDRECTRCGITVSNAEIDGQVDVLRRRIAPETIQEGLAAHHTTMTGLRQDFRQQIERTKLVSGEIKSTTMVHARVIFLRSDDASPGAAQPAGFEPGSDPQKRLVDIQARIAGGASFDDLADQYSEMGDKGDVGIVYTGVSGVDTAVVDTALKMKPGDVTPEPVKTYGGYFLLRAVSTSDQHPVDEDAAYASTLSAYREQQADMRAPQYVNELVAQAKVVNYLP